jgi:hypothetical protein
LLTVLVTALAGVFILWTTPHHSHYCCGTTFRNNWSNISSLWLDDVTVTSSALLNANGSLFIA